MEKTKRTFSAKKEEIEENRPVNFIKECFENSNTKEISFEGK
jgi:hypothetical protein